MRRPLVAANWKMNLLPREGAALVRQLLPQVRGATGSVDVVLCPPYTGLAAVGAELQGSSVALGAQNAHWEESGAFTGEVSPRMLLTLACQWVILGHSERRQLFGETDEGVNRRLRTALAAGLKPILCVGETLAQREAGQVESVVLGQLDRGLEGVSAEQILPVAVAYEPVWAIGTGRTATPEEAQGVHALIRGRLGERFSGAADDVRIQYGGSVSPRNAAELFGQADIDGGLIGGASLRADDFAAIVSAATETPSQP